MPRVLSPAACPVLHDLRRSPSWKGPCATARPMRTARSASSIASALAANDGRLAHRRHEIRRAPSVAVAVDDRAATRRQATSGRVEAPPPCAAATGNAPGSQAMCRSICGLRRRPSVRVRWRARQLEAWSHDQHDPAEPPARLHDASPRHHPRRNDAPAAELTMPPLFPIRDAVTFYVQPIFRCAVDGRFHTQFRGVLSNSFCGRAHGCRGDPS
jgi:hypothetical protein